MTANFAFLGDWCGSQSPLNFISIGVFSGHIHLTLNRQLKIQWNAGGQTHFFASSSVRISYKKLHHAAMASIRCPTSRNLCWKLKNWAKCFPSFNHVINYLLVLILNSSCTNVQLLVMVPLDPTNIGTMYFSYIELK